MRFVSFFAGIGGFDIGLERAGHACVGQVEIDPYALRVLERHWPNVPRWGDIRTLDPDELPDVELWCGGFPCQDISHAGRRSGIQGPSSGLWNEWFRCVRVVRPKFLLFENSPSLTQRGLDQILCDLASVGMDAEWGCIPAAAVGANHLRARIWLLAYSRGVRDNTQKDTIQAGWSAPWLCDWWNTEPGIRRVDDGVPNRVDRLRCLGNAVVPQVVEAIARRVWG